MAAGLLSSGAQVYSANIVGYVNKAVGPHFNPLANPFNAPISNSATNVLPNVGGALDGDSVQTWNGVVFTPHLIDSGSPTGWTTGGGSPETPPVLNPGTGWLYDNQTGRTNITFIGSVSGVITGGISNSLALPLSPVFNFVSSLTPVSGGLTSSLQLTNVAGARDGDSLQFPNVNGIGNLLPYTVRLIDSGSPTGYTDGGGTPVAEPQVPVGSYFIYTTGSGNASVWKQTFSF